ncbi:hypothetical protein [uncultured Gammaproteobacteria bacterium]|nr:hypothetical protein [uncultured Gammaproteobacteria bacterium]VVH60657.1 hypothetical protein BAZOLSSOX_2405 [uncultured Gammaproteobacteria bacterium]
MIGLATYTAPVSQRESGTFAITTEGQAYLAKN